MRSLLPVIDQRKPRIVMPRFVYAAGAVAVDMRNGGGMQAAYRGDKKGQGDEPYEASADLGSDSKSTVAERMTALHLCTKGERCI